MPALGGREVLRRIRGLDPGLPVIIGSGCSKDADQPEREGQERLTFLAKPFRGIEPAAEAEALGRARRDAPPGPASVRQAAL